MPDILSQEEIDALLSAYNTGAATAGARAAERGGGYEVRLSDFARPERFSKEEIKQLEAVNRAFGGGLGNYLSALLRSSIEIEFTTLDQASFDEYLKSVPSTTLISTFRLDPGNTRCIIEINHNVAFTLVDLLTGGDGNALIQSRELTDIEMRLMDGVIRTAMAQLMRAWEQFGKVECQLERVGSNQMVNPICTQQERVLSVYFEARVGNQVGLISLCFPIYAIEGIFEDFGNRNAENASVPDVSVRTMISENLCSTRVNASAVLGSTQLSLEDLTNLREGDLVRLEQPVGREIVVAVQGIPKYHGVPGIIGRKFGVHITREIESEGLTHKEAA